VRTQLLALVAIGLLAIVAAIPLPSNSSPVRAASDQAIQDAIDKGLAWLAMQEQPDGHLAHLEVPGPPTTLGRDAAATCLALVKFEERGWELYPPPASGPFDLNYRYHRTVEDGLNYVFTQMLVAFPTDFVFVQVPGLYGGRVYETGICMMAVAASRSPDNEVPYGLESPLQGWKYRAVLQGMLDWMVYAQNQWTDVPPPAACAIGGWGYFANDASGCDNSNTGYATLGIGFATSPDYGFALALPAAVRLSLGSFVNEVQDPSSGGSYYTPCKDEAWWLNILKTGNLLYEMKLLGATKDVWRVQAAVDYIESNWSAEAVAPYWNGWREWDDAGQGYYQAMFSMMKGLVAYGIDILYVGPHPWGPFLTAVWFDWVSDFIVSHQEPAGYWTGVGEGSVDWVLETSWALLTLEKVVAVPPEVPPPPKAVGGTVELAAGASDSSLRPAHGSGPSAPYGALAGGAAAAVLALTAGAWYARRRWLA